MKREMDDDLQCKVNARGKEKGKKYHSTQSSRTDSVLIVLRLDLRTFSVLD